jgi:hypothetical protein
MVTFVGGRSSRPPEKADERHEVCSFHYSAVITWLFPQKRGKQIILQLLRPRALDEKNLINGSLDKSLVIAIRNL